MPSREDQLTPISTMSPNGVFSESINSGSSCATVGVYGHQPPSTPSPSSVANVRRIGLAWRRWFSALLIAPLPRRA